MKMNLLLYEISKAQVVEDAGLPGDNKIVVKKAQNTETRDAKFVTRIYKFT